MSEYLPDAYKDFRSIYPEVANSLEGLATVIATSGPLDNKTQRLIKLALAIGANASGAARSNVRRARAAGASDAELRHVALLALTTAGFPSAVAGLGWIAEVPAED